jgi:predicted phage terminase large subunit-like protein
MASTLTLDQEIEIDLMLASMAAQSAGPPAPLPIAATPSGPRKPQVTLHRFVHDAWHVLDPYNPLVDNWHIGAICEHLTACTYGQIRKLVINIPPGFAKSKLACVYWPMWEWTFQPHIRWLFSSYNAEFATRDSLYCRDLIQSEWYKEQYGSVFALKGDQNLKTFFQNNQTGYRICFGAGSGTGARGDRVVVDDPHNIDKAESEADRTKINQWWTGTMSTRGNDPKTVVHVVIMQRLAEDDLSGHVLAEQLGYEHLCLPMHYSAEHSLANIPSRPTPLNFTDPRAPENGGAGEGALLFPERYPEPIVNAMSKTLKGYSVAGQFEQNPTPRGGIFFQIDRIKKITWDDFKQRNIIARVRYWDKAATEGGGAWTVGALVAKELVGVVGNIEVCNYIIEDVVRERREMVGRERLIRKTADADAAKYGEGMVHTIVEREPGGSGKDIAKLSIHNLAGHAVSDDRAGTDGDKETRAEPMRDLVKEDCFFILIADWTDTVLDKLRQFPKGGKDETDAIGGATRKVGLYHLPPAKRTSGGIRTMK